MRFLASTLALIACFQLLEICSAQTSNHWKRLPDLPDKLGVAGAFAGVRGGTLVVAGGANFPDKTPWEGGKKVWYDTIYSLDKPNGKWLIAGKLPAPRAYGISVQTLRGLLLIGGSGDSAHFSNFWLINRHANVRSDVVINIDGSNDAHMPDDDHPAYTFSADAIGGLPTLPFAVANACGAYVNYKIYVAGGTVSPTSTVALSTFLAFDERWQSWSNLPTWPGPARQLAIAGAYGRMFCMVGGTSLDAGADGQPVRTYLKDAYAYNSVGGWKRIADLPFPLAASPSPAATVNGKLIIFGGDDAPSADPKTHKGFRDEMLEYDPATDKWTIIGHMPAPRATAPVVLWNGGYVIVSGEVRRGVRSREVWMWTP